MPIRVQVVGHGIVEFPDGTSQEEMQKALATLDAPSTKPQGQTVAGNTFAEKIGNAAKALLPSAGGIAGGVVGGVPGAAIGGAAGEGYKQLAEHVSEIPGAVADVARNLFPSNKSWALQPNGTRQSFGSAPSATMTGAVEGQQAGSVDAAKEAGAQGVGQIAGNALAAATSPLSKWLMGRATTRVTAKLMQDFPELNDTLIDNALTVSKGGYGKAYSMLMAAKAQANKALKVADAAGASIPVQVTPDLADSLKTAILEKAVKSGAVQAPAAGQPLTAATDRLNPAMQGLFAKIDQAAASGSSLDLQPTQADLLKTQLQKESRALYANRTAPNGQKAMGMDATARAEFATQLNNAIDAVASGYKAANAEAKPLIGAVRGIKQAIRPNGNLYQAMVRPAVGAVVGGAAGQHEGGGAGSVLGAVAGAALTSPAGMSREAILLAHPAFQGALRALPKPLADWLLETVATRAGQPQSQQPEP